jgi:hypothetical protein
MKGPRAEQRTANKQRSHLAAPTLKQFSAMRTCQREAILRRDIERSASWLLCTTTLAVAVMGIVRLCPKKEMGWVHAFAIIAAMENAQVPDIPINE